MKFIDDGVIPERLAASKQFWRSLGFRRVGSSSWFAFSDNPDHPSRHLDTTDDWDDPEDPKQNYNVPESMEEVFESLSDPELSGDQCVLELQESLPVDINDTHWSLTDESGNTLLHLAAISSKGKAVKYIFSRRPDLASVRNREGDTPLEALQANMESVRTRDVLFERTRVNSDMFVGFQQSSIACIGVLSGTQIFNLDSLSSRYIKTLSFATDEQASLNPEMDVIRHTLRLQYGCTCGECVGGFLVRE